MIYSLWKSLGIEINDWGGCGAGIMSDKSMSDLVGNFHRPSELGSGQVLLATRGPGEFAGMLRVFATGCSSSDNEHHRNADTCGRLCDFPSSAGCSQPSYIAFTHRSCVFGVDPVLLSYS